MAVRRSFSPTLRNPKYRSDGNIFKNSTNYDFPIQTTPPLSFQQYARSITTIPGAEQWQSPGIYRSPPFHSYLSPETRKRPKTYAVQPWNYSYRRKYSIPAYTLKNYKDIRSKSHEPIWHPPGHYIDKRPTSLSPETKPQKTIREPVWHHPGHYIDKRPTSLSPEIKPQRSIREPVWHYPGRYLDKRPTSLSPERKWEKPIRESIWHPAGRPQYESVPYFDPPNLRWSLQQLRTSMPDLRTKTLHASRSTSVMKSQYMKDY
jgi:hypothetical protein